MKEEGTVCTSFVGTQWHKALILNGWTGSNLLSNALICVYFTNTGGFFSLFFLCGPNSVLLLHLTFLSVPYSLL